MSACDIKIITKTIANRIANVLPTLISPSQMAYVPGRDINFNNRILNFISEHCITNLHSILSFDAEKAYDSLEHPYIRSTLQSFGFPDFIIDSFNLLYANNEATVQINGWLSSPFEVKRGVKQGCALSCCLFVLCLDPLLRNIDANPEIKGIVVNPDDACSPSIKVLAYADDVAVTVQDDSVQEVFNEYELLYRLSGLKLNAEKTERLALGGNSNDIHVMYCGSEIVIKPLQMVKICGNVISLNKEIRYQENVASKVDKIGKILQLWANRRMSIVGKMVVVKTFALSQLAFVSQFMSIESKDMKQVESLCYKFAWNGCRDRIKRSFLKSDRSNGGIRSVDIDCYIKAIQIRQYFKADRESTVLRYLQASPKVSETIKSSARESLNRLYKFSYSSIDLNDVSHTEQILLANTDIRGFCKTGTKVDCTIAQFAVDTIAKLIDYDVPRGKINLIIKSLPLSLRPLLLSDFEYDRPTFRCWIKNKVVNLCSLSTKALQVLLKSAYKKCETVNSNVSWNNLWDIRHPDLRFQRFKLAHGAIFSNVRRYQCRISNTDKCEICGDIETVEHQLVHCTNAKAKWLAVERYYGISPPSFSDLKSVCHNKKDELIYSVIVKLLIQIDRSRDIPINSIINRVEWYLKIEDAVRFKHVIT